MPSVSVVCFLDFDHTLFNTDEFFHVDVRNSFLHFGIDIACWEQTYTTVWQTAYTLEKHAEEIYTQSGRALPLIEMKDMLQTSFADLRKYLFPDVILFLDGAKRKGFSLYLLSFGNPQWQRYKVAGCGIYDYFSEVFFTAREGMKANLILEKSEDFNRVVMVDNNPSELDLVKDIAPNVQTWCINRVPDELSVPQDEVSRLKFLEARRYLERAWRHPHIACKTLNGIL